ncbi:efflux RND transporter permease subunit [Sphingobacterium deserti]|uniref:Transporter, hydrophobe/amphiphile efflux-1 (HAE1) family n=1 Tax=Sphingobacterium deserti TaxID=1229276 RepID=A0A0B8T1H1_9SPHI|nr:efflux RND transporter permease subunit [Sphingobacterium deserti]KGE14817.1 transporter, hydrophobe/amphiphile efflux-1 (HAE1) family [Sphingobacterium deserti]
MFETYIRRPVLSLVISIFITLLGLLALFSLPITQFPDIVPPSVVVTANYTGANADVSTNAVAIPLEKAINGVAGMTSMNTVTTNNGTTLIQVAFQVGVDPDIAAVNVQNRVTTVLDELPEEVIRAGVTTEKEVNSMLMYLNIYTSDETADERFIYNFTDINILKELKRIEGVGFAQIMGMRDYAMRVWLKPDRLAAYQISTDEVIASLRRQNIEAAPGQTGISSDKTTNMQQYVLRYPGKFSEPEEYANIAIRANTDGSIIRVRDIADVEFGSLDYEMVSKTDGRPSASIMVKQLPGSNAQDVIQRVKDRMEELKTTNFPSGMTYTMGYDVSRFLDASISSVVKTLIEAFILVFLVVFIFLQDFRATIIPILAVPVSLIGALFFMMMMGFSINLLTLFALVLAIGIVVDNGIVVVEAVYAKMEEEHLQPMEATLAAIKEVGAAVIAITLVMSAVFVPVAFLSGPVGIFYRQFSLTLASAIVISGINALTLTPALCAIILRSPHDKKESNSLLSRFFRRFNAAYDKTAGRYRSLLAKIVGRRVITIGLLATFFIATWGASSVLPSGFIPTEDQGMIYVSVTTPPGATVDRTEKALDEVDVIARNLEAVETVSTLAGYSILTEVSGASYGMGMINLKAWDQRTQTVDDMINELRLKTAHIADAEIEFFPPPTVPGFGNASGFELRLLDRSGNEDLGKTAEVLDKFLSDLAASDAIESASSGFDVSFPQYMLNIDYDLAAKKGISVENAMNTLQTLMGSFYATNFIRFGQMYKVMVQADPNYRQTPEDVLKLYLKTADGEMVPYSSFITMKRIYGPEQITRYNMFTSAMITGQPAPGFSTGQAIETVLSIAENLPQGYSIEWSGMTREQVISGDQAVYIFALCLVFVYLLLSAQYESFLLPLPVILCLPAGVFGSFLFLKLFGLENNIYAQVALVMLIGLLGKNAILIVEYAVLKQKQGMGIVQASIEGAYARLRPILMTSFAFIAGLIPLMLASGAGAIGNRTIGTASVGGMIIGTLLGVIIIPGLFVLVSREKKKKKNIPAVATILLLLGFFVSCNVPKQLDKPQAQSLPKGFSHDSLAADMDSATVAHQPWEAVFSDVNLKMLIDSALIYNYDLQQAIKRIEIAQASFKQRKAALLPSLDLAAEAGLRKYGFYTEAGIGNYDSNFSENLRDDEKIPEPAVPDYFIGVRASWELDLWGKLKSQKNSAFNSLLAENEARRLIETELVTNVASAYYDLLSLDAKIKVFDNNIELNERALEISVLQKEAGRTSELGVRQFTAIVAGAKAEREKVKQEIAILENHINYLVGRYNQPVERSADGFANKRLFEKLDVGTPFQMLASRPDIREASFLLLSAEQDVKASKASFLPTLVLSPYMGLQTFSFSKLVDFDKSLTYGLLGGLTAPLFNQRQLKSQYETYKATYGLSFLEYEKRVLQAYNEVSNAVNTQEFIQNREQHIEDQVLALRGAVDAANELFIAGRVSYLDIITAQKDAIVAEIDQVEIQKEELLNEIVIYKALGGGWR